MLYGGGVACTAVLGGSCLQTGVLVRTSGFYTDGTDHGQSSVALVSLLLEVVKYGVRKDVNPKAP